MNFQRLFRQFTLCSALAMAHAASAVSLERDPYVPDPIFSGAHQVNEDFGAILSMGERGGFARRTVRTPDGDLILVGVTSSDHAPQGNQRWNLGLARLDQHGMPSPWNDPTPALVHGAGHRLTWPRTAYARIAQVNDVAISANLLFVLYELMAIDDQDSDVYVAVFSLDGQFVGTTPVFDSHHREYGAGLVFYSTGMSGGFLAMAGTRREGAIFLPVFRRFHVGALGQLTAVTGTMLVGHHCSSCRADAIALAPPANPLSAPRFYLSGASQSAQGDWDFMLVRVLDSGGIDPAFGQLSFPFNQLGSNRDDLARDLLVESIFPDGHHVYVAGEVSMACRPGMGVLKVDQNGALVSDFGNNGRITVGGLPLPCQHYLGPIQGSHGHRLAAISSGQLVLAGYLRDQPEDEFDGWAALLDKSTGAVREQLWLSRANASQSFHDIVDLGSGRLALAGAYRYHNSPVWSSFLHGRNEATLVALQPDRLFGNGFN